MLNKERFDEYQVCTVLNDDVPFKMALYHKPCSKAIPFLMGTVELTYIEETMIEHNMDCDAH